jgi:hypothetical protein
MTDIIELVPLGLAVDQLVATTKHHVGVEEAELLPDFRKNSEAGEREVLGRRFEDAKTKAPRPEGRYRSWLVRRNPRRRTNSIRGGRRWVVECS